VRGDLAVRVLAEQARLDLDAGEAVAVDRGATSSSSAGCVSAHWQVVALLDVSGSACGLGVISTAPKIVDHAFGV
jgi:hypothetical protein